LALLIYCLKCHAWCMYVCYLLFPINNNNNVVSDWTARSEDGREFQARAAATGNARSPSVERRVEVTTRVGVTADRRWRRADMSEVRCSVSARYGGAVPCRHGSHVLTVLPRTRDERQRWALTGVDQTIIKKLWTRNAVCLRVRVDAAIFVYVRGSWNSSWSRLTCSSNTHTQVQTCLWFVRNLAFTPETKRTAGPTASKTDRFKFFSLFWNSCTHGANWVQLMVVFCGTGRLTVI